MRVNTTAVISGAGKQLRRVSSTRNAWPDCSDPGPSTLELHLHVQLSDRPEPLDIVHRVTADHVDENSLSKFSSYREGTDVIVEDGDGEVIHKFNLGDAHGTIVGEPQLHIIAP